MATRTELEAAQNWRATVEYRGGRQSCIMRTLAGGLYLHHVEYDGLFMAGATATYNPSALDFELDKGIARIIAGDCPDGAPVN